MFIEFKRYSARVIRPPGLVLAILFFAGSFPGIAGAQTFDAFTVYGIEVDVEARSASQARDQAIAEARRHAFDKLMDKLVLDENRAAVPPPDFAQLREMVSGFEIESEKRSNVRYIGRLNIQFYPSQVRAYLRSNDISFSESVARPYLVLPVYEGQGAPTLWETPNPWWQAWEDFDARNLLFPFVLPERDFEDMTSVSANELTFGRTEGLKDLMERYGVADALIATAQLRLDEESGRPILSVHTSWVGSNYATPRNDRTAFRAPSWETRNDLFPFAINHLITAFERNWKRQTLLDFSRITRLTARIPLRNLEQWVRIRSNLQSIAQVAELELISLTSVEAVVDMQFLGDSEKLALALAQVELDMTQTGQGLLILDKASPPPDEASSARNDEEGQSAKEGAGRPAQAWQ